MKPGGYKRTKEIRKKNSIGSKRMWQNPAQAALNRKALKKKSRRRRMSIALKHKYATDKAWVERRNAAVRIACRKRSRRQKLSKANRGKVLPEAQRRKISKSVRENYRLNKELRELLSQRRKAWLVSHPNEEREMIRRLVRGIEYLKSPNKSERKVWMLLEANFPGRFRLNCTSEGTMVGRKIPDFICRPRKVIVEFFGAHWHGEELTGRTRAEEEGRKRRYFAKFGYRTVIIWPEDLRDVVGTVGRIRRALATCRRDVRVTFGLATSCRNRRGRLCE